MAPKDVPTLSTEVIAHIVGFLGSESSALLRFCLVSRSFNTIATPLLYASYRQGNIWESSELDRFYLFLNTVLQRPELARYVKNISVGPLGNDEPYSEDMSTELTELCRRRIHEICSGELAGSINDEARDAWIGYLEGASPQAVLTVLLCSLPNLEIFFFEEGYQPVTFWLALQSAVSKLTTAQTAGSPPPNVPFTKLHSVDTYSREGKYGYMCFTEVCQFFNLPSMETFEIALSNGEWDDTGSNTTDKWEVPSRSSSIERLSFRHSALTEPCMRKIIDSCAHLKDFRYTYGPIHMYGKDFTPMELLRQLLHHADSLETLVLNYDDDWNKVLWEESEDVELYFSSDLTRMTRLKKLSTNFSALFGIVVPTEGRYGSQMHQRDVPHVHLPTILPDSLEELEVVVCDERIVPHLQELAEARSKQRYPKLRKVRCMMVEEQTDRGVAKIEMPGVDIEYEFLDVNQRAHLIYEISGPRPNDSGSLFDEWTLFGLNRSIDAASTRG